MKMRAVICTKYGPPEVLQIQEVEKPVPKDDEVLIKVFATSAHIGDTRIRRADPFFVRIFFGLTRPRKIPVLGMEISGVVEEIGKDVQRFYKGDEVFAFTGWGFGGYGEFICLPAETEHGKVEKRGLVEPKPKILSFEEAATIPAGALTTLKVFQKMDLKEDQKIMIYGASGSLGTFAVQFAKEKGAKITGICTSGNFELIRSLGANHTIDYTKEDITARNDEFDIIYDAVGKLSRSKCKKILKKKGHFITTNGLEKIDPGDLETVSSMIEEEKLKPVMDRIYTMDQIVEAHGYVDTGRKKGNVAITVHQE